MLSKVSSFSGPSAFFNTTSGTPSLVLSLDALGLSSFDGSQSGTWSDFTKFNNDATSDGPISFDNEVSGCFVFDGSSAYFQFATVSGIPLGDSQYTIEAWFKSNSYEPSEQGPFVSWGSIGIETQSNVLRLNANGFTHYWWANDISVALTGSQSMITDNWYHVVSTYDGINRKLYLNGSQVAIDTPGVPHQVNDMSTLKIGYDTLHYFDGKISKVKVRSKALTAQRVLSSFNSDKIRHGYEFGSMTLGGTSSFALSTSADYVFGTDDYTLEGFFNCATYSDYSGIVGTRNYTGETGVAINLTNTGLIRFLVQNYYHDSITASTDTWYHVALSRVSGTTSCYINGDYIYEFTDTTSYVGEDVVIGKYYTNEEQGFYFNGIISNIRLINGVGLYSGTASFEVPSTQLQSTNETDLLIVSQKTSPVADVSGNLHAVTNNNIGWTSSLPVIIYGEIEFEYLDFSSTTGLSLLGSAAVVSNFIYLTPAVNSQGGNVWRTSATNFNRSFSLEWNLQIGGGSGADGFCVQWSPDNTQVGDIGGNVGIVTDPTTIVAIAFKNYGDSVIFYQNNSEISNVASGFLFGQNVYYWMDYDFSTQTMNIYYDTTNTKPIGSANQTFSSVTFDSSNYYIGFGAATGGLNDNHILKSMKLTFSD